MKDVARAAGVSPSTVSRVLAGNTRISPDTTDKVRAAVKSLNYHPNAIARSLVRKSTNTIGLIISRPAEQAFANPFFPEVMRGIGSSLQAEGYNLLLNMTSTPAEERSTTMRLLQQRRVDGVILTSARYHNPLIDDLLDGEWPFVLIGRTLDHRPVNWVNNDNVAVGEMAVQHLLSRGHTRIGLIHGPLDMIVAIDRQLGYSTALQRAGLPLDPELQVDGHFNRDGGYHGLHRLLRLPNPPTAIVCADDAMAVGALTALKELGLSRQVALMGVNDDPMTALGDPPLSTVRIPVFDLGATAATTLLNLLSQEMTGPRQVILPCQLVVRESTNWALT